MSDDQDLRAVVTSASSGIGAAYACALRARGERVVLVVNRAGLGHTAAFVQERAEVIRTMLDVNEDDARGRAPGLALRNSTGAAPAWREGCTSRAVRPDMIARSSGRSSAARPGATAARTRP